MPLTARSRPRPQPITTGVRSGWLISCHQSATSPFALGEPARTASPTGAITSTWNSRTGATYEAFPRT